MASKRGLGWLARGALLASALIVPACTGSKSPATNPGTTSALWSTTTAATGGTYGAPGTVTLLWNDPNTAPTNGGGGGGDLNFEQAWAQLNGGGGTNPFLGNTHPVVTTTPQNVAEEDAVDGGAAAYYATLVGGGLGGAGGLGGIGGGIGGAQMPSFYTRNVKLRSVVRAECKHLTITTATPGHPEGAPNSLAWRMQAGGVNAAAQAATQWTVQANGTTITNGASAWSAISAAGGAAYINGIGQPGWAGAGYYTSGGNNTYWGILMIQLPTGQVP